MTDDRLERALSDAITDLAGTTAPDYLDEVLEHTSRTRQRPWWTFPRRYLEMTPTLKFATAASLAFVLGVGAANIIDLDGNGSVSTGAAASPSPSDTSQTTQRQRPGSATEFQFKLSYAGRGEPGADGSTVWTYQVSDVDDVRFDGDIRIATSRSTVPGTGRPIWHGMTRIETDEGTWLSTPHIAAVFTDGRGTTHTTVLVGEGAYEGLVALTEMSFRPNGIDGTFDVRGYVFEGHLDDDPGFGIPPAPEAW